MDVTSSTTGSPQVNVNEASQESYDNTNQTEESKRSNELDKNAFFELLTTQLEYQDPMDPMDNTQFISQMAQFSSLEQMENMNSSMNQFLQVQEISEGASLIGKTVATIDSDTGRTISGEVTSVSLEEGKMYAVLNEGQNKIDVKGISAIS